jgi:hypothetical protein
MLRVFEDIKIIELRRLKSIRIALWKMGKFLGIGKPT